MFGDVGAETGTPASRSAIPQGWKIWRGGDDGYAAPMAVYWLTEDPDRKTIYVIQELYRSGLLPDQAAEEIMKRDLLIELMTPSGDIEYSEERLAGLYDSAAFAETGTGDQHQKDASHGQSR